MGDGEVSVDEDAYHEMVHALFDEQCDQEQKPKATEGEPAAPPRPDALRAPPVGAVIHELKCWPEYFAAIRSGAKTFEARLDDRGYAVGHLLHLREYVPGSDSAFAHYTAPKPKPWNAHATWNLTLYLPWDRLQESWRLRELSDEDLGPALLQILRSVREVDVRKSTDKFALEITIKSQTDEE